MKMPAKIYSYCLVIVLMLVHNISLKAIIIASEDIALQPLWESPQASKYQKFKIFLHDAKIKFPFSDTKNPRKAYLDFQPTCARSDISQQERAICRIIQNQNYFGIGLIIGVSAFYAFLNVLAIVSKMKSRYKKMPYIQPGGIAVPQNIRANLPYLDQSKETFSPFEILNISKRSKKEAVKDAYKKLSLQYHPDKHKDEKDLYTELFKIIGNARVQADDIIDSLGEWSFSSEAQSTPPTQKTQQLLSIER